MGSSRPSIFGQVYLCLHQTSACVRTEIMAHNCPLPVCVLWLLSLQSYIGYETHRWRLTLPLLVSDEKISEFNYVKFWIKKCLVNKLPTQKRRPPLQFHQHFFPLPHFLPTPPLLSSALFFFMLILTLPFLLFCCFFPCLPVSHEYLSHLMKLHGDGLVNQLCKLQMYVVV